MKKASFFIVSFLIIVLLIPLGVGFAQSTLDLGTNGSGLLPSNPFYFLKEFGRNFRKLLLPGQIRKADLELTVLNEKAAELLKLSEIAPDNMEALKKAASNYQAAAGELRLRFENIEEDSNNPNIDRLLDQLVDRSLRHQQLFDELIKNAGDKEFIPSITEAREKLAEVLAAAAKKLDNPVDFSNRFSTILNLKNDFLSELRAAGLLDNVEEKLSGEERKAVSQAKEDIINRLSGHLEALKIANPAALLELSEVPGDWLRAVKVLDELRERTTNSDLKNELSITRQKVLNNSSTQGGIGAEEVSKVIEESKKIIGEVEAKIAEREGAVKASVKQLLERAKFNLGQAETFYESEEYNAAFGQATAAHAAARNAWAQLVPEVLDHSAGLESAKAQYDILFKKINDSNLTKEQNPRLFQLLSEVERRIVELTRLIEQKAAPEVVASSLRNIKIILATIESLIR